MIQETHEMKITRVVNLDAREPHDETIYFVYFGHDLQSESFKDLLADVYNGRCVVATTMHGAFHPDNEDRNRLKQAARNGKSMKESLAEKIGTRRIYQVNFSMAASRITEIEETWREEQLPNEVD